MSDSFKVPSETIVGSKIVVASSLEELERKLRAMATDGWRPLGNPLASRTGSNQQIEQTVVRYGRVGCDFSPG